MANRIISMRSEFGYVFPELEPVLLIEEKEIDGIVYGVGMIDPEWQQSVEPILLIGIGDRNYFSVSDQYSLDSLVEARNNNGESSIEDYDIREDTQEDLVSVVNTLLTTKQRHLDKYKEDNNYLTSLGLPNAPEFLVEESEEESEPVGVATT